MINWNLLPSNVVCMAMDEDGEWYGYYTIPEVGIDHWVADKHFKVIEPAILAKMYMYDHTNWKESLVFRNGVHQFLYERVVKLEALLKGLVE